MSELPADLAEKIRALRLDTDFAKSIPSGPKRYVEILAAQVDSRPKLLESVAKGPATTEQAGVALAKGAAALLSWWQVHRYVGRGRQGDRFSWAFSQPSQVTLLKQSFKDRSSASLDVVKTAAGYLAKTGLLQHDEALERLQELFG